MLTCPKCVAELTQPIQGDTTTCPGCGLVVHVSSLSPLQGAVDSTPAPTQTYLADQDEASERIVAMPKQLGRYEILSLLGSGGFSLVYLAVDSQLGRKVALKVMRPERLKGGTDPRVLFEEARLAARLEHPGFVPVYDVAQDEAGKPFLVMQYLPGKSLRERAQDAPLSFTAAAELVQKLATAIHFAHKQHLFHRDLKPSNILFDAAGEPHIADLGLAVTEKSQIKRAGEWAGTLPYMAPEQVRGETHRLDGRCDIWSLGAIFYELLTGKRPFRGESAQINDEILHREPRPLRQLNENIPAPLEQICLKCLRKSLHERYLSAFDLAADLEQWLRGSEPSTQTAGSSATVSSAHESGAKVMPTPDEHLREASRSRRTLWLVAATIPVALVLGIGLAFAIGGGTTHREAPPGAPGDGGEVVAEVAVPSVDDWVPRRWHELLKREPEKLVWGDWPTARLSFDDQRNWLSIDTPDLAMLPLGQTESTGFRIQLSASKSAWMGGIGLFWGYRPAAGQAAARCYMLWIRSVDAEGVGALQIEREYWTLRDDARVSRPLVDSICMRTQDVKPPKLGAEGVLDITVEGSDLTQVVWNGQEFPGVCVLEPIPPPPQIPPTGKFGIVAGHGAVVVTDVRFMLTRDKRTSE